MAYFHDVDRTRQLFHHNWTRPKRMKSQVNGHTEMSQNNIILRSNVTFLYDRSLAISSVSA